jgi:hypothetical protein
LAGALIAIAPTAMAPAPIADAVIRRQRAGVVLLVMVFSLACHCPLLGCVQLLGEMVLFSRALL